VKYRTERRAARGAGHTCVGAGCEVRVRVKGEGVNRPCPCGEVGSHPREADRSELIPARVVNDALSVDRNTPGDCDWPGGCGSALRYRYRANEGGARHAYTSPRLTVAVWRVGI